MSKEASKFSLTPVVDALPPWMEEGHAAKVLLEQAARRGLPAFVRLPPQSIVIEEPVLGSLSARPSLGPMADVPVISIMHRRLKDRGIDVILHPVANPSIRFLELEQTDLQALTESGQIRRHWFNAGALTSRAGALVTEPATLRCIRPARETDSDTNQPISRLWSAVTHDDASEHSFSIADVYIRAADGRAFKHVLFQPEDEDPHRLFGAAPAVFGVYSAARKYALELEAIPRGQAPRDKKRLEEVRQKLSKHLAGFGRPLASEAAQKQVLKFIDPKFSWGSGAGHKSFAEAAATIEGFHDKYAYENFVGDGLGLIIYVAKCVIAQRFEERQGKPGQSPLTQGSVHAQLRRLNFTGNAEIEAIAAVILWEGPKAKRKTESEKRPGPIRAPKR